MLQVYPNEGLVEQLTRIANGELVFRLFKNDVTPDRDSELADFEEADWTNYAAITVDETDFALTGVTADTGYIVGALPVGFINTSGAPQDAYGYYVTDVANTIVLAAARFDNAPVTKANNFSWPVTPAWGDFSEQPE